METHDMNTEQLVAWFVDYQRRHTGTGSGTSMREAVKALFLASRSVDANVGAVWSQLLADDAALNRVMQMLWSHDPEPLISDGAYPELNLIGTEAPPRSTFVAGAWIANDLL